MTPEERAEHIMTIVPADATNGQTFRKAVLKHIRAAVAEEREACAKIVYVARQYSVTQFANDALADVEQAIRSRT